MPEETQKAADASPASAAATQPRKQDDDIVGKVYDARLMRRLLTYLRPYKLQAALSAVALLIKSASDVFGPYLVKVAVDTYFSPQPFETLSWLGRHLSRDASRGIWQIGGLYLASLTLSFGLEFAKTYMMQWTGQKIMFDLRSQIFRHIQSLHVAFFDRNPVGRLVTRVTSDVDALNEMFTSGVLDIFEGIFTLTWIVGIMLWMSWPLALLTLSVIPLIVYATKLFRDHVRDSYRRQRAATARINSFTQEYVSGMSIVQLFNREARAFKDFSAVNMENKLAWTDAIFAYALYYPVVELLSAIAIALVVWVGGRAVLHNMPGGPSIALGGPSIALHAMGGLTTAGLMSTVTLGVLIAFIQYAQRFFRPIMELSEKFNILQSAMAASERIFKLIDTPSDITTPATPTTPNPTNPAFGSIEFRNVWFTYQQLTAEQLHALSRNTGGSSGLQPTEFSPATNGASAPEKTAPTPSGPWALNPGPSSLQDVEWILRNVSFTIHPDETAAIVGHTGAGKTTLTALMMRFYDIQAGQVLVDGIDVRDQDLTTLRKRFGVVLQDPFLFSGTIANNIRLGSHWITDEDIANAAEQVNVADFIQTLPNAFAEPVLERGSTLSTGQKQLISFARALAHRPGILILDEATSSVDTDTEVRVRGALARMITGRTSVLIAHRLSTIQSANTILVMHKGRLREQGTHQQLLAERGLYYKLYQLQYKDQELGLAAD